jgi:hypothetical protein
VVVVVFECFVSSEVETDEDRDDLRIGHFARPVPVFHGYGELSSLVICDLGLKFFAKIIDFTENICNFVLVVHG